MKYGNASYRYDARGSLSYMDPVYLGDETDAAYLRNKYNSKALLTASYIKKFKYDKTRLKDPVLKVTYKKVKAQQQWIIRNIRDESIYNF